MKVFDNMLKADGYTKDNEFKIDCNVLLQSLFIMFYHSPFKNFSASF